jgi:hypothetical protein
MSKQFWIFLIAGIAVIGGLLGVMLVGTKSAHLELDGKILKVRVLNLGQGSFVVADFRVTNPSGVPFVIRDVQMILTTAAGEPVDASVSSKSQIDTVFEGARLIGTKYNDVLTLQDRIQPHQLADRMVAGRFELPEAAVNGRKSLVIRLEDVDGTVAEIGEPRQ